MTLPKSGAVFQVTSAMASVGAPSNPGRHEIQIAAGHGRRSPREADIPPDVDACSPCPKLSKSTTTKQRSVRLCHVLNFMVKMSRETGDEIMLLSPCVRMQHHLLLLHLVNIAFSYKVPAPKTTFNCQLVLAKLSAADTSDTELSPSS